MEKKGRLTLPTDIGIVDETIEMIERLGADAIRDCDGTLMPQELTELPIKKYATYYTTRKDNEWAKNNPEEIQQMYCMSEIITASSTSLQIAIMEDYFEEQLQPNPKDHKRWWEVMDRTTNEVVPIDAWTYDEEAQRVTVKTKPFHAYSVSFLAFIIWDPVHMYNALTNDWKDFEHQMTYDVRQPKTKEYVKKKLQKWIEDNPKIDVIRFTTFFHQFTLTFNKKRKEKYVDWFGYSASVSPYILEQFEKEVGYSFRAEYIVRGGTHNATFCVPTKEFRDFMDFQQREVSKLARELVDITHAGNKEAMMFLGDHWIGTEPYGKYFKDLNLDAVVGSVGNGTTLRLIADIPHVKYREGRLLPYFFKDSFYPGANPTAEAKENWVCARRAILRKPVDRIGYGGYLALALDFPEFIDYSEQVANEFRYIYDAIANVQPYVNPIRVVVLNSWGKLRSWGSHMSAHALSYKEYKSYSGVLESLSGMPFEVVFMSFDDILEDENILQPNDVVINVGDAYDAFSGGSYWNNEEIVTRLRKFVYEGGGFIGIGEPSAYQTEDAFFQLYDVLGVDQEKGFTISVDKYNWEAKEHFISEQLQENDSLGRKVRNIYAKEGTQVVRIFDEDVVLSTNTYGKGRAVYMAGLPYSGEHTRLLYRALYFAAGKQDELKVWYSDNYHVDVNVYPVTGQYCVVNNTFEEQTTTIYGDAQTGRIGSVTLTPSEIRWFAI